MVSAPGGPASEGDLSDSNPALFQHTRLLRLLFLTVSVCPRTEGYNLDRGADCYEWWLILRMKI